MTLTLVVQKELLGLSLNGHPPLFAGTIVSEEDASYLGWTGKTKTLSERFLVVIALLAFSRKYAMYCQHAGISLTDNNELTLAQAWKLPAFRGIASPEVIKRDISNHFHKDNSILSIQSIRRGDAQSDLLSLRGNINITAKEPDKIWASIVKYLPITDNHASKILAVPEWMLGRVSRDNHYFHPQRPIEHSSEFYGRTEEIQFIWKNLSRRPMNNCAILGSRVSGKTSLLRQLYHINHGAMTDELSNSSVTLKGKFQIIFVDFELPYVHSRDGLCSFILNAIEHSNDSGGSVERLFELFTTSHTEPTVIVLDSIDVAIRQSIRDGGNNTLNSFFWDSMRSLVCNYTNGNLAFMISARENPTDLAERHHCSSSFFNIFRTVELPPLSNEAVSNLIASSPVPFPDEDRSWIIENCKGWPGLLQIACDLCLDAIRSGESSTLWRRQAINDMGRYTRKEIR